MAKLLIVDDDPYITESLKVGLGDRGHQVFTGHNGREGVELVSQLMPDLVIIDMTMPLMDGLEATEQIRQQSDVPIIMLTAETDEEDIIAALETGVDEYLGKPFRLNELAARIQAIIRRRNWAENKTEQEVALLKQNLVATMTHELRTPIATILNTLEIVFTSSRQDNFQYQLRFLEKVQHNTHVLNSLVDDLLFLARIDAGLEILRRPFSLNAEIERLIDKQRTKLTEHNLTIHNNIEPTLEINGDTSTLRHLFYHLLDNAIKFSQPDQAIHIEAKTNGAGEAELSITDEGIGIHPDHHSKIFERFYQIDRGDNRAYGGMGIGLTIAKAITEAHGGQIWVTSEPDAGSKFTINLPITEPDWQV